MGENMILKKMLIISWIVSNIDKYFQTLHAECVSKYGTCNVS